MKIVRPYGASATEAQPGDRRRRVLRLTAAERGQPASTQADVAGFAAAHGPLLVGQWISVIDRIATKPKGKDKPTTAQRALRDRLGRAAWKVIVAKGLLADPHKFKALWDMRIAPYPDGDYTGKNPPGPRGRWYARFAGDAAPEAVDADKVAGAIHAHLHLGAMRARPGEAHPKGLIEARANSIAASLPAAGPMQRPTWSAATERRYAAAGDVAAAIHTAARARESGSDEAAKTRWVGPDLAMAALAAHHGALFRDESENRALTVREIKARARGDADLAALWTLHEAVRDLYTRILKRHRKTERHPVPSKDKRRKSEVARLLPRDMNQLFSLLGRSLDNRELSALIRLGRVLHYEAADRARDARARDARAQADHAQADRAAATGDGQAHVLTHWPEDHADSRYWTSDGLTEIKGVEAFVRVWRRTLVFAARTLSDWCAPEAAAKDKSDILTEPAIQTATNAKSFNRALFARKAALLFGGGASHLTRPQDAEPQDTAFERAILRLALRATSRLRNGAFHFTGLGGFVASLKDCASDKDGDKRRGDAVAAARALWEDDVKGRGARIRDSLIAAHCGDFFNKAQNARILAAVAAALAPAEIADAPLPRFVRVIDRAKATRLEHQHRKLPDPVNREKLESQPARLCQYVTLKLLYERPFRRWLSTVDAGSVNAWIEQAVERSTVAARNLNTKKSDPEARRALVVSRAASLGGLERNERIQDFMARLTGASAGETRVQNHYESDGEKAREQAAFIDELLCDVIARAFIAYLLESDFAFVLDLGHRKPLPPRALCDLAKMEMNIDAIAADDWQAALYLVAHLAPVGEVGKLLHQLRKFEILERKRHTAETASAAAARPATRAIAPAAPVMVVLELYLDMHDAKFTGGAEMDGLDGFAALYQDRALFERVMTADPDSADDRLIPRRGLREVARFGGLEALAPIFAEHAITKDDVSTLEAMERPRLNGAPSDIVIAQRKREHLHKAWTDAQDKRKREGGAKFTGYDCRDYVTAVATVARHRRLAAHVRLVDHLRLYRIMISVLGRLVDFSGLWERDLYFAALAIIHGQGKTAASVFSGEAAKSLSKGVILKALSREHDQAIDEPLSKWFDVQNRRKTRNDIAHLNMLAPASKAARVAPLTAWVAQTRALMAHDRKLKNAVTKSVIDLLAREKLTLSWLTTDGADHTLKGGLIDAARATHLKGRTVQETVAAGGREHKIAEDLYGRSFVEMAARLFGAKAMHDKGQDVAYLPIENIDWTRAAHR